MELRALLMRSLAKDPGERPPDGHSFAEQLRTGTEQPRSPHAAASGDASDLEPTSMMSQTMIFGGSESDPAPPPPPPPGGRQIVINAGAPDPPLASRLRSERRSRRTVAIVISAALVVATVALLATDARPAVSGSPAPAIVALRPITFTTDHFGRVVFDEDDLKNRPVAQVSDALTMAGLVPQTVPGEVSATPGVVTAVKPSGAVAPGTAIVMTVSVADPTTTTTATTAAPPITEAASTTVAPPPTTAAPAPTPKPPPGGKDKGGKDKGGKKHGHG
jgi:hypothetical protein